MLFKNRVSNLYMTNIYQFTKRDANRSVVCRTTNKENNTNKRTDVSTDTTYPTHMHAREQQQQRSYGDNKYYQSKKTDWEEITNLIDTLVADGHVSITTPINTKK